MIGTPGTPLTGEQLYEYFRRADGAILYWRDLQPRFKRAWDDVAKAVNERLAAEANGSWD